MARATRVSVADRIKSQPIEAIKTVMGTTATAVGSYLKVELDKAKAANGAARTANGLERQKLEISIWSQQRDYLNSNVTRAEQELKDAIRHDESRITGAAGWFGSTVKYRANKLQSEAAVQSRTKALEDNKKTLDDGWQTCHMYLLLKLLQASHSLQTHRPPPAPPLPQRPAAPASDTLQLFPNSLPPRI